MAVICPAEPESRQAPAPENTLIYRPVGHCERVTVWGHLPRQRKVRLGCQPHSDHLKEGPGEVSYPQKHCEVEHDIWSNILCVG